MTQKKIRLPKKKLGARRPCRSGWRRDWPLKPPPFWVAQSCRVRKRTQVSRCLSSDLGYRSLTTLFVRGCRWSWRVIFEIRLPRNDIPRNSPLRRRHTRRFATHRYQDRAIRCFAIQRQPAFTSLCLELSRRRWGRWISVSGEWERGGANWGGGYGMVWYSRV